MKLYILTILIGLMLLASCNSSQKEEYNIIGEVIGPSHGMHMMTVFVEDNLSGGKIDYRFNYESFDPSKYEVEAYQLALTKDTKIIVDYTEEEFSFENNSNSRESVNELWMYSRFNNEVAVKTKEDFEQKVLTDREQHIAWDRDFLPIYTAEEIRVFPMELEEYFSRYNVHGDNVITVVEIVEEMDEHQNLWEERDEFYNELQEYIYDESYIDSYINYDFFVHNSWKLFNEPLDIEEYPVYYIFYKNGVSEIAHSKDEVILFFEEMENK